MLYEVKQTIIERLHLLKDKWIWAYISYNDRITWDIISDTLDQFPWVWSNISYNKNITWENIKENLHLPWNWETLTLTRKITWEIIQENPQIPWAKELITYNPNITLEIAQNNRDSDIQWDIDGLTLYSHGSFHNMEWDFIVSGLKKLKTHNNSVEIKPWNWDRISNHPQLTWKFIESNPFYDWNWRYISARDFITIEIVMNNLNKYPWQWNNILMNKNMTWDIIHDNFLAPDRDPSIEINWVCISQNPNITWAIINKFPNYPWNYSIILKRNDIIEEILETDSVKKYPMFDDIYERFYVDIPNYSNWQQTPPPRHILTENIELDADTHRMELVFPMRKWTASLTFEKIKDLYANQYHLCMHKHMVSENPNVLLSPQEEEILIRRHLSAFKIIRVWRDCISTPNHPICDRRLKREFNHLKKVHNEVRSEL